MPAKATKKAPVKKAAKKKKRVYATKTGRPTKYKEEYVEQCYSFFDRELFTTYNKQVATNRGVEIIEEREPNRIPTIEGFAIELRVNKSSLYEWSSKHPDFSSALDFGRQKQKEFLNYHALSGNYNSNYAKFFAINSTDMVEKKVVEHTGDGLKLSYNLDDANTN